MRFPLIFLIVLFSIQKSFSFEVIPYNEIINQAEMSYVKGNHVEANNFYTKAFSLNEQVFLEDIENAMYNALKGDMYGEAFQYAFRLADFGVGNSFFEKNSYLSKKLKSEKLWEELIQKSKAVASRFEKTNKNLLERINKWNQSNEAAYKKVLNKSLGSKKAKLVFDSNADSLFQLFQAQGFLNPFIIGATVIQDTLLAPPVFTSIIDYSRMVVHENGKVDYSEHNLFIEFLHSALEKGWIDAYYFNKLLNSNPKKSIEYPPVDLKSKELLLQDKNPEQLEVISNNRKEFGLCSLEDYNTKIKYLINNPNDRFKFDVNIKGEQ